MKQTGIWFNKKIKPATFLQG